MRHAQWLVFDEYLVASSTAVATTNQDLNSKLGMYDQLAIQAVVDNVTPTPTAFKVQILHSADGRVWMPKNGTAVLPGGTGEVTGVPVPGQNTYFGFDPGTTPTLAFVQLSLSLTGTGGAHVRLYVTARDWGGR